MIESQSIAVHAFVIRLNEHGHDAMKYPVKNSFHDQLTYLQNIKIGPAI